MASTASCQPGGSGAPAPMGELAPTYILIPVTKNTYKIKKIYIMTKNA